MLSVTYKPLMLNFVMLNIIMLSMMAPSVKIKLSTATINE
jgi:hypothetical protein